MASIPFPKRVAEILKDQKITQVELANVADVTKGLVNQWISGVAKSMSYDAAQRLGKKYGYELDWLLKGEGNKFDGNTLPERGRTAREGRAGYDALSLGPDIAARVPLISWVKAGKFEEARDNFRVGDAEDWYPMPKKAGARTYCLRVEGDSMTAPYGRTYPAGSIIFVDPDQRSPANGRRIIAKLNGSSEVTFKVFVRESNRVFLKPLNPQYPPITEPFKIIGTVVGKWEEE